MKHPPVNCTGCGVEMKGNPRRAGTKCRACCDAERRNPDRFCEVCGKTISKRAIRTTTLCRSHAAKSAERIEKLRASMKVVHADPEYQRRRGRSITAAKLAHIPLEYRDDYMRLSRSKGLPAKERVQIITDQVTRDTDRYHKTGQLQRSQTRK